jgi:hypothetical protein
MTPADWTPYGILAYRRRWRLRYSPPVFASLVSLFLWGMSVAGIAWLMRGTL